MAWYYLLLIGIGMFCLLANALAMIEIIGSWVLTKRKQGIRWNFTLEVLVPLLIPFGPILEAACIIENAEQFYKGVKQNKYHYRESLYCYLKYGGQSIDEYYKSHNKFINPVPPKAGRGQRRSNIVHVDFQQYIHS